MKEAYQNPDRCRSGVKSPKIATSWREGNYRPRIGTNPSRMETDRHPLFRFCSATTTLLKNTYRILSRRGEGSFDLPIESFRDRIESGNFFLSFFWTAAAIILGSQPSRFSRSIPGNINRREEGGKAGWQSKRNNRFVGFGSLQLAPKGETDTKLIRNSSLKYLTIESRAGHVATKG